MGLAGEARGEISGEWHMPCTTTCISTQANGGVGRKTKASLPRRLCLARVRRFFMEAFYGRFFMEDATP